MNFPTVENVNEPVRIEVPDGNKERTPAHTHTRRSKEKNLKRFYLSPRPLR